MFHFLLFITFVLLNEGVRQSEAKCFFKVGRTNVPIFCHGKHRLYTGKFSAGNKDGLLCHNVNKSTIEILIPPDNYRKQNLTFCEAEYAEVVVGDFNGDGRADLMCREPEQMLKVFYADKNGRYSADVVYEFNHDFCPSEIGNLAVVSLNGDKSQDVICHHNTGEFSYSYGREDGTFPSSVFLHIDWCNGNDSLLLFGDFNGDGITDLLCHNTNDGSKAISLGNQNNLLSTQVIEFNMNWCNGQHEPFTTVSDVNGDGLDDLICKDKSPFGETIVAHAQEDVLFAPQDVYKVNFCINGGRGNFYTGDFNGDGKSDLLCQTFFGTREIDISGCV